LRQRGLTPRSSGAPTAGHQARAGGTRYIFTSPGLATCRRRPLSSNVRPQKLQVMHSDPTLVAALKTESTNPALLPRVMGSRLAFWWVTSGVRMSLRSPTDSERAESPNTRLLLVQFHKRASRGRAAPRSQFLAVAAIGSAFHFASTPQKQPCPALRFRVAYPYCKAESSPVPFGERQLWPNPSVNRTLHGLPAFGPPFHSGPNTAKPFRAGYFKR
jgi:hypothetical protein